MDKQAIIDREAQKAFRPHRALTLLAVAVLILVVALVGLTTFTTVYVRDLQETHEDEIQKLKLPTKMNNYEVDVVLNSNSTAVHERVSIYEDQQLAFNIIMDPQTGFIMSLMTLDFYGKIVAKYDAESEVCYFTEMDDTYPSFERVLNTLQEHNGGSVSTSTVLEYTRGERMSSAELIPALMTPYCAVYNSYWLEKQITDSRVKRDRAVERVVIIVTVSDGETVTIITISEW